MHRSRSRLATIVGKLRDIVDRIAVMFDVSNQRAPFIAEYLATARGIASVGNGMSERPVAVRCCPCNRRVQLIRGH